MPIKALHNALLTGCSTPPSAWMIPTALYQGLSLALVQEGIESAVAAFESRFSQSFGNEEDSVTRQVIRMAIISALVSGLIVMLSRTIAQTPYLNRAAGLLPSFSQNYGKIFIVVVANRILQSLPATTAAYQEKKFDRLVLNACAQEAPVRFDTAINQVKQFADSHPHLQTRFEQVNEVFIYAQELKSNYDLFDFSLPPKYYKYISYLDLNSNQNPTNISLANMLKREGERILARAKCPDSHFIRAERYFLEKKWPELYVECTQRKATLPADRSSGRQAGRVCSPYQTDASFWTFVDLIVETQRNRNEDPLSFLNALYKLDRFTESDEVEFYDNQSLAKSFINQNEITEARKDAVTEILKKSVHQVEQLLSKKGNKELAYQTFNQLWMEEHYKAVRHYFSEKDLTFWNAYNKTLKISCPKQ